jgi:hypothetical protein
MTGINYLIAQGPQYDIPGAFQQGVQQGQQQNMLAAASQAAQRGDYAALGNALLQLGDVSGALTALKTPEEQRRTRALEQRQAAIDELNRRNIESEMKARQATMEARDLRAVGNKVVDFSDPNNPRVVYSTPTAADALAAQLDGGGAPPAAAPTGPAPAPAIPGQLLRPGPLGVARYAPAPEQNLFGPQPLLTGGAPAAATPPPAAAPISTTGAAPLTRTGTLADLTPQQRATARTLLVTDPTGATANKFVTDILTGVTAAEESKRQQEAARTQAQILKSSVPQKVVSDAQTIDRAYKTLDKGIDDYKKLIEKTGATYFPGAETQAVRAARTNLQLLGKEVYNLGVLNGPDLSLMQSLIFDPEISATSPSQAAANIYHAAKGDIAKVAGDRLEQFRTMLKQRRDEAVKGILPGEGGPGVGAGAESNVPQSFLDAGGDTGDWEYLSPADQAKFQ